LARAASLGDYDVPPDSLVSYPSAFYCTLNTHYRIVSYVTQGKEKRSSVRGKETGDRVEMGEDVPHGCPCFSCQQMTMWTSKPGREGRLSLFDDLWSSDPCSRDPQPVMSHSEDGYAAVVCGGLTVDKRFQHFRIFDLWTFKMKNVTGRWGHRQGHFELNLTI